MECSYWLSGVGVCCDWLLGADVRCDWWLSSCEWQDLFILVYKESLVLQIEIWGVRPEDGGF